MCRADTFQSETNWSRYIRWLGIRKHENRITKSIPPFSIKRSTHFGLRLYKHLYTSLGENSHLLYWFREIYIVTLHLQHRKYITQALLFHALQQKKDDTIVIIIKGLYHITSSHTQPCKKIIDRILLTIDDAYYLPQFSIFFLLSITRCCGYSFTKHFFFSFI